jgi:hypothetical protein
MFVWTVGLTGVAAQAANRSMLISKKRGNIVLGNITTSSGHQLLERISNVILL